MTRKEIIKKLIADDLENIDDYGGIERHLEYVLEHGHSGYNSYSDIALEEEYEDRIGKLSINREKGRKANEKGL